jgi:hypothetical protein
VPKYPGVATAVRSTPKVSHARPAIGQGAGPLPKLRCLSSSTIDS